MVLQSAPCHKDYIHTLGSKIGAWEGGQKIGQTDRQTDKPNYNIDYLSFIDLYNWFTNDCAKLHKVWCYGCICVKNHEKIENR